MLVGPVRKGAGPGGDEEDCYGAPRVVPRRVPAMFCAIATLGTTNARACCLTATLLPFSTVVRPPIRESVQRPGIQGAEARAARRGRGGRAGVGGGGWGGRRPGWRGRGRAARQPAAEAGDPLGGPSPVAGARRQPPSEGASGRRAPLPCAATAQLRLGARALRDPQQRAPPPLCRSAAKGYPRASGTRRCTSSSSGARRRRGGRGCTACSGWTRAPSRALCGTGT